MPKLLNKSFARNLYNSCIAGTYQLETIHRKLISKRSCSGYFATWRYLLESFLIESSCGKEQNFPVVLPRKHPNWYYSLPYFERCAPPHRERLLLSVMDLFRDWPRKLHEVLRDPWLRRPPYLGYALPQWFKGAVRMVRRNDQYSLHYVRDQLWSAAEAEGWLEAAKFLNALDVDDQIVA